mgnify:CR=1 FL=1
MSPEHNGHRPEQHRAASPSAAGRQVLDELHAANAPLDAAAVAERLGVHVTTARFHLDRLADAGLARRRTGSEPRRGRPRILYTPIGPERDEESREQLIHVLASALPEQGSCGLLQPYRLPLLRRKRRVGFFCIDRIDRGHACL